MRRLRLAGIFLSLSVLCLSAPAYAQDASLIGSVTDDTRAVLPGATITATGLETGVQAKP